MGEEDQTVDVLANTVAAAARDGEICQSAFDDLVAAAGLPARMYAALRQALVARSISITDGSVSDEEPDAPDEDKASGGWNANGFDHFLKRNWHDVLTPEEEHHLLAEAESGRLAQAALDDDAGQMPTEIRRQLDRRAHRGDRATEELICSNIRLVAREAHRLKGRCSPALSLEDLFDEGVFGLARAIEKFDINRGFKLSTYATWWIRQSMERAIADKSRSIRLPVHLVEQIRRVKAAASRIESEGRRATPEAIAAEVPGVSARRAEELLSHARPVRSLDAIVAGGGAHLGQFVASPGLDPCEVVSGASVRDELTDLMDVLNARERQVIVLRFGFEDGCHRTLEEVGREFGLTRERIRQIESKAIKKLQVRATKSGLREYMPPIRRTPAVDSQRCNA